MKSVLSVAAIALAMSAVPGASAFELGPRERVGYDVSLALRWRVNEVTDPLALEAKVVLERPAGPDASRELRGRLDFKRAVYVGPVRKWRLDSGMGLPVRARRIASEFSPAATGPGYAGRLAAMEELLGLAAAAAHGRRFRATVANDGNVTVAFEDRAAIEQAIPDPAGRAALDAYVGQALRFVLEDIRPGPEPQPGGGARAYEPGAPYTLEAIFGARFDRKLDVEALRLKREAEEAAAAAAPRTELRAPEPIDLRLTGYDVLTRGQASVARGNGLILRRKLEVEQRVSGQPAGGRGVNIEALVKWQAVLTDSRLASERAVATRGALGLAP